MEKDITTLLGAIQSGIMIYILFSYFRDKFYTNKIVFFSVITITFIVLKNRLITFEPYTIIDGLAWAVYNVMIYYHIYSLFKIVKKTKLENIELKVLSDNRR